METQIVKRGEICLQSTVTRSHVGLTLSVKVHPRIEEFMLNLAPEDARISPVGTMGRFWKETDIPLNAYNLPNHLGLNGSFVLDTKLSYRLDKVGYPILEHDEYRNLPCINMSFLRLVGLSEGAGITFKVPGVYTTENARKISEYIGAAGKAFYMSYLKPIDLTVMVSTQEM